METGEDWLLQATSTDLKSLLKSFRIFDPEDQTQPTFAKSLLYAIQCNKIVDTINLLSTQDVVLLTNISGGASHAKSEEIYVFEVEVCCKQGTLKVNEKVCRRMTVSLLFYILDYHRLQYGFYLFCNRMLRKRMHFFIQLPETWLESYGFTANQLMLLTQN